MNKLTTNVKIKLHKVPLNPSECLEFALFDKFPAKVELSNLFKVALPKYAANVSHQIA
jgi:hypothetical protein